MDILVSVLIPVYNVEKTLDRCIKSVLSQTFRDYEIILVNDGSTDNSGKICDNYAKLYDNIRVIHKENEGLGPTRNVAIKASRGKYIYHCDSDDWIKPDLLEKGYRAIVEADADVVVFGYDLFTEKGGNVSQYGAVKCDDGIYLGEQAVKQHFVNQYFNSFIVQSACNRICKRSFIMDNELFFPPLRRCQDMAYSLLLFDCIKKLVTLKDTFYCYVIEPGVYKGRAYSEMLDIYCTIFEMTSEYFDKWGYLQTDIKTKLINNICEQIANYSVYANADKFRDSWKYNTKKLLSDRRIVDLFEQYNNNQSRFMMLFCFAFHKKSRIAIYLLSLLTEFIKRLRK